MIMSNNFCVICRKDVSSKEVNGKVHNGGGIRCGGNIEFRTYKITIVKQLISINNEPIAHG